MTACFSSRPRAALAVLKAAADPQPKRLPLMGTLTAELEALNGYCLATPPAPVHNKMPKTRTIVHNGPIRMPAEPGRNSACPGGSGQKFKRCCASREQSCTTAIAQAA